MYQEFCLRLLLIKFGFLFAQGNIIDLPQDEDTPEKRVDKIFKQMDKVSHQH